MRDTIEDNEDDNTSQNNTHGEAKADKSPRANVY